MVQSAYVLDRDKPAPGKGRIHFHALLGHVLRGTSSAIALLVGSLMIMRGRRSVATVTN
jgi:hypothetical protein